MWRVWHLPAWVYVWRRWRVPPWEYERALADVRRLRRALREGDS